jgi:hypothetical protein
MHTFIAKIKEINSHFSISDMKEILMTVVLSDLMIFNQYLEGLIISTTKSIFFWHY